MTATCCSALRCGSLKVNSLFSVPRRMTDALPVPVICTPKSCSVRLACWRVTTPTSRRRNPRRPRPVRVSRRSQLIAALRQHARPIVIEGRSSFAMIRVAFAFLAAAMARASCGRSERFPLSISQSAISSPPCPATCRLTASRWASRPRLLRPWRSLALASRDASDTRSEIGARFDRVLALYPNAVLTLRGRVAWAHDLVTDPTLVPMFQALPGSSFVVYGATPAKNSTLTSAGAELRLANGVTLLGKFDGEFAPARLAGGPPTGRGGGRDPAFED